MTAVNNAMYNVIVAKLGFDPKDYSLKYKGYECDTFESPFEVLTVEELEFLLQSDCFSPNKTSLSV